MSWAWHVMFWLMLPAVMWVALDAYGQMRSGR
jgi:hypothetical protein